MMQSRVGLGKNTEHALEEMGKQFDTTRERIYQIEAIAMRKLKNPACADKLMQFLER
ncbi:Sigma-70, region 4 [Ralstonia sp. 25mfcol4.1]|uniref:sigma factor-like helix-turn-helix DNA-binding protein n=1 Tax=Ralstonia sp. 25mfcol4.1 TaxID=1761899 RepID=UPI00042A6A88|nr:sigma factor-like helix-turn-helix DNA-binding protein [Ralstonia sp. 25mfcol4.1]SDP72531.1 Sigma-70, region 4 [Ralstonia sp. 25mfcol4.1]